MDKEQEFEQLKAKATDAGIIEVTRLIFKDGGEMVNVRTNLNDKLEEIALLEYAKHQILNSLKSK